MVRWFIGSYKVPFAGDGLRASGIRYYQGYWPLGFGTFKLECVELNWHYRSYLGFGVVRYRY